MDLSVIIPVKDERDNIRPLHERLRQVLQPLGLAHELVFVDDGSIDGSHAVLEELAAGDPGLKVVRLRRNYGQSAAMQAGIDWSTGAVLVTMHGFIPVLPQQHGARLAQIPVSHHPRSAGKTKYNLSRTVRVVLDLITVKFLHGYLTRPMHVLGLGGLIAMGLGVVSLLVTIGM